MSENNELKYQIALSMVPGIGGKQGRRLIQKCGGAKAVFNEKGKNLLKIEGIGLQLIRELRSKTIFDRAEKEERYISDHGIEPLFISEKNYPRKLRNCPDAPLMLYFKGSGDWQDKRTIGIVGTRRPSEYGKEITEKMVQGLKNKDVVIISGLAYGIDTKAHHTALQSEMMTLAVLAHGHDTLYPAQNIGLAKQMLDRGGLITEFPGFTKLNKDLFPRRNRIIAGLSDAVVVIESDVKGGGMITARIASSYNRDVFGVPGSLKSKVSAGPHFLIKTNVAGLVENAEDIIYQMGWDDRKPSSGVQKQLFTDLNENQQKIYEIIMEKKEALLDEITCDSGFPPSKTSTLLLEMEFKGVLTLLPGGRYKLI